MELTPDFAAFEAAWKAGQNQLVTIRLAADLDTPVSLMLKLAEAAPMSFMLESVTGGEVRGRYSIVGMKPDLIWDCRDGKARINRNARYSDDFQPDDRPALDSLRALIAETRIDMPDGVPAGAAGLFGYLGYDMIRLVERLPDVNPDPLGLPDAMMLRPSVVAVLDGVKGEVTLCAPVWRNGGDNARAAYAQAAERVMDALRADSKDSIVLVTPAFPETGRTVYQGNLFVGSVPLNESPLKDHPLNPKIGRAHV